MVRFLTFIEGFMEVELMVGAGESKGGTVKDHTFTGFCVEPFPPKSHSSKNTLDLHVLRTFEYCLCKKSVRLTRVASKFPDWVES